MGEQRLAQADISALPFAANSFDLVVFMDVLPHLLRGSEDGAIAEFWRLLAPGGLLILRVAALEVLRSRHSQFAHERQRFARGRLAASVRRAGVRVLRSPYANALLMPVAFTKFDCDYRLIRRALLVEIQLRSTSGTICVEMVRKLELGGCEVKQVGVHRFPRLYGRSQFLRVRSLAITFYHLLRLRVRLVVQP